MHHFKDSGMISTGEYDYNTRNLSLTFTKGGTYTYANFPGHLWIGLTTAISPGKFFHANIRNQYTGVKQEAKHETPVDSRTDLE